MDAVPATWVRKELEPLLEAAARNVCGETNEGAVLRDELKISVQRAMDEALAALKGDLTIDLEQRVLTTNGAVPIVDAALMDQLVPLKNRRALELAFGQLTEDKNEPLCVVLFDIDHFKDVNDKNGGHAIGDEALVSIAKTAAACVRGKGEAFRFGGDEFIILLPNHSLQEGLAVAERFRRAVHGSSHTSKGLPLTVSVGVAIWPEHGENAEAVREAADQALYDAKHRNRNLVRYFGEPAPTATVEREPERKQPDLGDLTSEQQLKIRQDYFRSRVARCPNDDALLEVEDVTSFGQSTRGLFVTCPLCGLTAELE
jgi:diguanylate cyclase (GGDEF)-like protein